MVQALSKRMANVMRTDFDRWGKYNGSGAVLRGKTLGLIPTTIRVFVFNAGEKTINVTEDCPDDEQQQLAPGFRTIEDSFRVLQEGK